MESVRPRLAINDKPMEPATSEAAHAGAGRISVALLTGGGDRPYAFGLGTALAATETHLDVIGSDDLDFPEFHDRPNLNFLNLRGGQRSDVGFLPKAFRILKYYVRLIRYAATATPKIFHVLWNNKFEAFDRTLLMLYYKLLGKRIVLTVHNVNAGRRDAGDSTLNRLTLKTQYRLADHLFVHTAQMKQELVSEYGVRRAVVSVIPFGINNSVPNTCLTTGQARQKLGLDDSDKVLLFFGNIAPYKGLEYLVDGFRFISSKYPACRLVVAGAPKNCEEYWKNLNEKMSSDISKGRILVRPDFIPDSETEIYFKAADAVVLPYRHIYQSGVLFLGLGFGIPSLVSDVGAMAEEIVDGENGFVFRPEDSADLAKAIDRYFSSELYAKLSDRRDSIRERAEQSHSWGVVSEITNCVYAQILKRAAS